MANRQGDQVKERYSIRLEPSKKNELVEKFKTLQAGIEDALNLDLEKHIELAHEYALAETYKGMTKNDKVKVDNGRRPDDELFWKIFTAYRDGYRCAKGRDPETSKRPSSSSPTPPPKKRRPGKRS